jgi:hypothetical protein
MRFKNYLKEAKTMKIFSLEVELKKSKKSDMNISYELYKEKNGKQGIVRQYDNDAKDAIETKKFPKFEDAKKYYEKLLKLM